eukprot:1151768-Pelagomonas_calceolata.AAC.9
MSLPHQRVRGKLVWVWWVSGSMQPQDTRIMSRMSVFNGTSVWFVCAHNAQNRHGAFVQAWYTFA